MVSDFYKIVDSKSELGLAEMSSLSELISKYPYFVTARKMYIKALQTTGNIHFQSELNKLSIYLSDKRPFYFYLYPDMKLEESVELSRKEKYSGSYFDFLEMAGPEKENSLKSLAEKLKNARNSLKDTFKSELPAQEPKKVTVPVVDYFKIEESNADNILVDSEEQIREMIKMKKYQEALDSMKRLNLNNPKKSVYFADQIRFLEKVIQYQHN